MEGMILRGQVNGLKIYRKAGTSAYYVRVRDGVDEGTTVRDLHRWAPIGTFASYESAAEFVRRRLS